MPFDTMSVVEHAYALDGSNRDWLGRLATCVRAELAPGSPMFGFTYLLKGEQPRQGGAHPVDFASLAAVGANGARGKAILRHAPPGVLGLLQRTACTSLSAEVARHEGEDGFSRYQRRVIGDGDFLGLWATNPDGSGTCLFSVLERPVTVSRGARGRWLRVAAHIAAGLRLRTALRTSATGDSEVMSTPGSHAQAVLSPGGRLQHAGEAARHGSARDQLRNAVKSIERARTRRVRHDPGVGLELWQGLVGGRWSMVERFDSDGRRYYVAFQNSPAVAALRALSERERQVVAYARQGLSAKLIGYHLGMETSTVCSHLARARKKLGVASRLELVRVASALRFGATG